MNLNLKKSDPEDDSVLLLSRIEEMSQLVTARQELEVVVDSSVSGYTGSTKMILVVCGHVEMQVDLSSVLIHDKSTDSRTITIGLPMPQPRQAYLNLERTRVHGLIRSGLWQVIPGDAGERRLMEQVTLIAQRELNQVGHSDDLKQKAQWKAEQLLEGIARDLGWKLLIRWY